MSAAMKKPTPRRKLRNPIWMGAEAELAKKREERWQQWYRFWGPQRIIAVDASEFNRVLEKLSKQLRLEIKRLTKFEKESRKAFLKDKKKKR